MDSSTDRFSRLMDSSIRLPGGFRIGLDGLLGLIPGVGDLLTGLLSAWLVIQGHREGAPLRVLVRMVANIVIDAVIGSIPLVGDFFDFFWKANEKNAALLRAFRGSGR